MDIKSGKLEFPKIDFLATVSKSVKKTHCFQKQCSAINKYAKVTILIEPNEKNAGFEFANKITGVPKKHSSNEYIVNGWVPDEYISYIEMGIKDAKKQCLKGFTVSDIKCSLLDVSYHKYDSSRGIYYSIAAKMAFKEAFRESEPIFSEPIMDVKISGSSQSVYNIIKNIKNIRGEVCDYTISSGRGVLKALIPDYEIQSYVFNNGYFIDRQIGYEKTLHHYGILPEEMAYKISALYSEAEEN